MTVSLCEHREKRVIFGDLPGVRVDLLELELMLERLAHLTESKMRNRELVVPLSIAPIKVFESPA